MMCTTSPHHAVHAPVSERHVCRLLLSLPLSRLVFWVLLSLENLALLTPLLRQSHFRLHLTSHHVLLKLNSPAFLFSVVTPLHNAPYKLVESGLTTHCPCQLKTGPVSSRQIHMSIVYKPLLTSGLITVPSRMFRMCEFFSSSTTVHSSSDELSH